MYDKKKKYLYSEETLQEVCLGIHSMCVGAESKYFDGHTNITAGDFLCFGVKGLMDSNRRLKDAMLFNILSYMSKQVARRGEYGGKHRRIVFVFNEYDGDRIYPQRDEESKKKGLVGDTRESEYRGLPSAFDPRIYETAVFYSDASILIQCGANQPEGIYGRVADRAERVRTHTLPRTPNVFVPLREREILA